MLEGLHHPSARMGAYQVSHGVEFSVYSYHAISLELLLFTAVDDPQPAKIIPLCKDPSTYIWSAIVPDLQPGQLYGFRAYGPFQPLQGQRFNPARVLLDPYGRAVAVPKAYNHRQQSGVTAHAAAEMKSVLTAPSTYDWAGDQPLHRPYEETVIYELHVKGFTRHPSSGLSPEERGTYQGMMAKIPYLLDLGITAVELLPIFQYDATSAPPKLINYWGYEPVGFFAPHLGYSASGDPLQVLDEFRAMVHAFHRAGIEVILDVVYNHTAEGNQFGPTFCFRGLDNPTYYILKPPDDHYANFSGTGNTLNVNHPVVRRLIIDSLCYWVEEMHIDGFRFDLAAIFNRNEQGAFSENSPLLHEITQEPRLAQTKLIAEPWDAAGLYRLGHFPAPRWREWNGKFRDDVRNFVKGSRGSVRRFAARFLGSADIYGRPVHTNMRSINFVTCHDGFTLADLVSYNHKHNAANGEHNRDGTNANYSWNCGIEGPTTNPAIEQLRIRQIKNFFVIQLLAFGVPMLTMGDEVCRSQQGNNNAYCQDNEISWFNWTLVEKQQGLLHFVQKLTRLRSQFRDWEIHACVPHQWHGVMLDRPDWAYHSHSLALSLHGPKKWAHFLFNAYWEELSFALPKTANPEHRWQRVINTSLASPQDICLEGTPLDPQASQVRVPSRSIVLLLASA